MFETTDGIRKLQGAERRAFIDILSSQLDNLREDIEGEIDLPVDLLNHVPGRERPYVFLLVAEALLNDAPPMPLRAWNEAVIGQLYDHLEYYVLTELDGDDGSWEGRYSRKLVSDAWKEVMQDRAPRVTSQDEERWVDIIEDLKSAILIDSDFTMYEEMADDPNAGLLMKQAGISPDYFSAVPPIIDERTKTRLDRLWDAISKEVAKRWDHYSKTGRMAVGASR